jgi:hypothetical protein
MSGTADLFRKDGPEALVHAYLPNGPPELPEPPAGALGAEAVVIGGDLTTIHNPFAQALPIRTPLPADEDYVPEGAAGPLGESNTFDLSHLPVPVDESHENLTAGGPGADGAPDGGGTGQDFGDDAV